MSQCKQYGGQRKIFFSIGDRVLVKCFFKNGNKTEWKLGTVKERIGAMMYIVYISDLNTDARKHVDHLLKYNGVLDDDDDDNIPYYDCSSDESQLDTNVTPFTAIEGEEDGSEAAPPPPAPVGGGGRPVRSTRNPNPRYKV
ncbi:hypothetical protein JYU34_009405 [Plutella xylostella]|uniref:Uncharacterized protein n=1 Tax=Plutella xylostella TaxID=51655 RepID=A0ABQ7QJG5_PLUXY|nr:hypothetical protein JYU34_009405 [Plutella xylostella]